MASVKSDHIQTDWPKYSTFSGNGCQQDKLCLQMQIRCSELDTKIPSLVLWPVSRADTQDLAGVRSSWATISTKRFKHLKLGSLSGAQHDHL